MGRSHALRIEKRDGFVWISFLNYDGRPRRFTGNDFWRMSNGAVLLVGDRRQMPSGAREAYARLRCAKLADHLDEDCVRAVRYADGRARFDLRLRHYSVNFITQKVDGKPVSPPMLECPISKKQMSVPKNRAPEPPCPPAVGMNPEPCLHAL